MFIVFDFCVLYVVCVDVLKFFVVVLMFVNVMLY